VFYKKVDQRRSYRIIINVIHNCIILQASYRKGNRWFGETKISTRNGSLFEDSFWSPGVGLLDLFYLCPFFRTETADINREICKKIAFYNFTILLFDIFVEGNCGGES
jgi:hypothetical protein